MPDHSKHLTLQSFNLADKLHTITPGKVTTLDHKVLDNTVECRALVSIALLTGSQNPETVVSITSPSYTHTSRFNPYRKFSAVYVSRISVSWSSSKKKARSSSTHLGNRLSVQSKHHPTHWIITMMDIKVDLSYIIVSIQTAPSHHPDLHQPRHTLLVTLGPRGALSSAWTRASANAKTINNERKKFLNRMIALSLELID